MTSDRKVQPLTDIGPPLKVTSTLENFILLIMAMAVIAVLILFCTTPISRKILVQGQLASSTNSSALQNWNMELYLPSTAIGALSQSDYLDIRFDAFPWRNYGIQTARVNTISDIPISTSEVNQLMLYPSEVYYRVQLDLPEGCSMPKNICDKWRLGMRLNSIVVIEKTVFIDRLLKPITAR